MGSGLIAPSRSGKGFSATDQICVRSQLRFPDGTGKHPAHAHARRRLGGRLCERGHLVHLVGAQPRQCWLVVDVELDHDDAAVDRRFGGFHAELLKKPLQWEDGYVIPSSAPGLGVELNEEVALAHPYEGDKLHLEMAQTPLGYF